MGFYEYFPIPSDRMGSLWTLMGIQNASVLEFGPTGNTSFAGEGFIHLNTPPEARIFSTHMGEEQITFGGMDRLYSAIKEIDALHGPEIIFIMGSSLGAVTGMDLEGACVEIQPRVKARLIPACLGGYKGDFSLGIRNTIRLLCSDVVKSPLHDDSSSYNILGCQPDDFTHRSDSEEIRRLMKNCFNLHCAAVFTSNANLGEIQQAANSGFNVVMRSEALDGARILKERFGREYVMGRPYGKKETLGFLENVSRLIGIQINQDRLRSDLQSCEKALAWVKSLATQKEHTVLVSGNHDLVMGIGPLLHEMGFERIFGIINHEQRGDFFDTPQIVPRKLLINPSEEEKKRFLEKANPDLVLGDAVVMDMLDPAPHVVCHQISNPNLGHISLNDQTPCVGFKGLVHLCEKVCNGLASKQGARLTPMHGGGFGARRKGFGSYSVDKNIKT